MEILEKLKDKKIIYFVVSGVILIVVVLVAIFGFKKEEVIEEPLIADAPISTKEESKEVLEYYYVDIKGEVNNPGVYKINSDSRVIDVINAAGGLKENANTRYINLSKKIEDEMNIVIYSNNEIETFKEKEVLIMPCECEKIENDSCIENNTNEEVTGLININTATLEELMNLNGIGEAKAKAIIEYRENKLFESIEELNEVKGISDAIYSKIKDFITCK